MMLVAFELGYTPAEFWELTFVEFRLMVRAFNRKLHREQAMLAALQANIMNHLQGCLGAKGPRVTVNQIMGGRSFDKSTTREEITEHFRSVGKLPQKGE